MQIFVESALVPGDRRERKSIERRRMPALDLAAGEMQRVLFFRAERVARRMTGRAMAEAFDEIGAAVPQLGVGGVWREGFGLVEQRIPRRHQWPLRKRKCKLRRAVRLHDG